jgi:methionyl-tRNA synthetase
VAGIAEKYTPEELIGKQIIVVANLKPAKLMGIVSNGMLLAAVDDSGPTLATLEKPVAPGTPLR